MKPGMVVHTFIPELEKQRQANLYESEASLMYTENFRPTKDTYWDPALKTNKQQNNKKESKENMDKMSEYLNCW